MKVAQGFTQHFIEKVGGNKCRAWLDKAILFCGISLARVYEKCHIPGLTFTVEHIFNKQKQVYQL